MQQTRFICLPFPVIIMYIISVPDFSRSQVPSTLLNEEVEGAEHADKGIQHNEELYSMYTEKQKMNILRERQKRFPAKIKWEQ